MVTNRGAFYEALGAQRMPNLLYPLSYFFFKITDFTVREKYDDFHFSGGETEAQRRKVICSR